MLCEYKHPDITETTWALTALLHRQLHTRSPSRGSAAHWLQERIIVSCSYWFNIQIVYRLIFSCVSILVWNPEWHWFRFYCIVTVCIMFFLFSTQSILQIQCSAFKMSYPLIHQRHSWLKVQQPTAPVANIKYAFDKPDRCVCVCIMPSFFMHLPHRVCVVRSWLHSLELCLPETQKRKEGRAVTLFNTQTSIASTNTCMAFCALVCFSDLATYPQGL